MRIAWTILILATIASLTACARSYSRATIARSAMVWDAPCLSEPVIKPGTRLEAPLDGAGNPDMAHAKISRLGLNIAKGCGRIEVRK